MKYEIVERGLLLLQLRKRVPVVEEEILEQEALVVASGAVRAPEADEAECLSAGAYAGMQNVGVAQCEVRRVENLPRPAGAHDV